MKIALKKIGNSTGIILPKDLLSRLDLKQGDEVFVTEGPDKSLTISPHDPHHEEVMRIGRELFQEYRATFKALAK